MEHQISRASAYRLFLTQFLLPSPIELIPYFFASLLVLLVMSNRILLVILADGTPVTEVSVTEVFGQRFDHITGLLAIPILGRVVLFLFWLGIGSIVYMLVWLFQNLAVEVYDDLATPKLKDSKDRESEEGWWGTTLSHTIFLCSSILLLLFYAVITINFLLPAWALLFQIGLQTINEAGGVFKLIIALFGTMLTLHIFVLFWRLFTRLKGYIYNNFY